MCEISVIQIFGLIDNTGQITTLIVDGTTEDCNQINVTVEHTGSSATTSTKTVTANAAGQWRSTFKSTIGDFNANDFACGQISSGLIRARAVCVSDTNCQDNEEFKVLNCGTTPPPLLHHHNNQYNPVQTRQ